MTPEKLESEFGLILSSDGETWLFNCDSYKINANDLVKKLNAMITEEREACAKIAEQIRARELKQGVDNPDYAYFDTIAEEIRDRIQMRPATSNSDWAGLK